MREPRSKRAPIQRQGSTYARAVHPDGLQVERVPRRRGRTKGKSGRMRKEVVSLVTAGLMLATGFQAMTGATPAQEVGDEVRVTGGEKPRTLKVDGYEDARTFAGYIVLTKSVDDAVG